MLVSCPLQKLLLLSLRPAPERTIKRSLTAKVATGRTGWCYKCPVALSRFPPYSLLPPVHVACCRGLTINESLAFLAARIMMITLPLSTPCSRAPSLSHLSIYMDFNPDKVCANNKLFVHIFLYILSRSSQAFANTFPYQCIL